MSFNLLRNNLAIKISSSLNADYIFDKTILWCFICYTVKHLHLHQCFNQFFSSMLYINKDTINHFIFLIVEPSNGSNLYSLVLNSYSAFDTLIL